MNIWRHFGCHNWERNDLTQTISSAVRNSTPEHPCLWFWPKELGPTPYPVYQQIKKLSLWASQSSRIIYQAIYLGWNQEEHTVKEAGIVLRPPPAIYLSLVVMLLSGTFSTFLFLLFDESAIGLESLTYTVVSAWLFTTEWPWVW